MGILADHVTVDVVATRSVNLERDATIDNLSGYVPTARAVDTLARIVDGLSSSTGTRAWSITGPYGSGKSAFALFLDTLIGPASEVRQQATALLDKVAPQLSLRLAELDEATNGIVRATTVASIERIGDTVARAIQRGVRRRWGLKAPRAVGQTLRRLAETQDASTIRKAIEAIALHAPVLIIIDEFGKSLEYHAATAPGELFLLQELAELFSGHDGVPGGLVTLQHLAFDEYAAPLSASARREWAKVQGRFEDITFVDAPDQVVRLIANGIKLRPSNRAMAARLSAWTKTATAGAERLGLTTYIGGPEIVGRCYPIHPVALAALPTLCSQYGQYERSLISFLASGEADSVVAFCARNGDRDPLPTIGLAAVYDYFVAAARTLTGAAAGASKWLEVEARINEAFVDEEDLLLLKIVGVLNLVSGNGPLRASPELVVFASDLTERRGEEVRRRLAQLCERRILVFRSFANEYRLWHGTDFDVSGAIDEARELLSSASPAQLFTDAADLSPIIAGRHSQEKGILRYFDVLFAEPGSEITYPRTNSDGLVIYMTGPGPAPIVHERERPTVLVQSSHVAEPLRAALELAAIRRVLRDRAAELGSDWVARRELQERAAHASVEARLRLAAAFAPGRKGVRWVSGGRTITSKRGPSGVLSVVCDRVFSSSPTVRNEMIARRELTSQGAKARRELMQAMLANETVCQLGLESFGPERAIYHAVLEKPGFHRVRSNGEWAFGPPHRNSDWGAAWNIIQDLFTTAKAELLGVDVIYARLRSAPVGIKDGVIPILLVASLLHRRDDIAIYEEGTYQPRLSADLLERLVRNPDRFSIKNFATSNADRRRVIDTLARALNVDITRSYRRRNSTVLALLAPLLGTVRDLPEFVLKTGMMSEEAVAVRDALIGARQPDEILFRELPVAVGLADPSAVVGGDRRAINEYARRLASAVRELQQTWPMLLARIEDHLRTAMATPPTADVRSDLAARAQHLIDRVLDPRLRSFLVTAVEDGLDRTDWLEAIALNAVGKPVRTWRDQDWPAFVAAVTQLGGTLKRLEALNYEHIAQGSTEFAARRVTITKPDGTETSTILVSREGDDQAVNEFAARVAEQAREQLHADVHPALVVKLIDALLTSAIPTNVDLKEKGVRRYAS